MGSFLFSFSFVFFLPLVSLLLLVLAFVQAMFLLFFFFFIKIVQYIYIYLCVCVLDRNEWQKGKKERTNVLFSQASNTRLLVRCKNNMRNSNTPSVGSSSRSMKFSTRHACGSCSFRLRAVVMVIVAGGLCN